MLAPFALNIRRQSSGSNLSSSSSIVTIKHAESPSTSPSSRLNPTLIGQLTSTLNQTTTASPYAQQLSGSQYRYRSSASPSRNTDGSASDVTGISKRWSGPPKSNDATVGVEHRSSFSRRSSFKSSAAIVQNGPLRRTSSLTHTQDSIQATQQSPISTTPILISDTASHNPNPVVTINSPSAASGHATPDMSRLPHPRHLVEDAPGDVEMTALHHHVSPTDNGKGKRKQLENRQDVPLGNHSSLENGSSQEMPLDNDQGSRDATVPSRSKSLREKDKKTMLSRALQRANTAVEMDNAQNYTGAMEAYGEACEYLSRVMSRSSNEEDRRKLHAIRATYTARVEELQHLESQWKGTDNDTNSSSDTHSHRSSLRPISVGTLDEANSSTKVRAPTLTGAGLHMQSPGYVESDPNTNTEPSNCTARFETTTTSLQNVHIPFGSRSTEEHVGPGFRPASNPVLAPLDALSSPSAGGSALHPYLGPAHEDDISFQTWAGTQEYLAPAYGAGKRSSGGSNVDASRLSRSSSNHSLSSSNGIRRKHLRVRSGNTEAEFDAALDAAVEAAYNEGYEPYDELDSPVEHRQSSTVRNNPPLYAYNSFAEREAAILAAKNHAAERGNLQLALEPGSETDEEERMLEEITRDFMMDNHTFDEQAKSALPRQSDSSGSSGNTWGSTEASSLNTNGTALSPVKENSIAPSFHIKQQVRMPPPPTPPPTGALPQLPKSATTSYTMGPAPPGEASSFSFSQNPSVQDRRLPGQKIRKLQIKTAVAARRRPRAVSHEDPPSSRSDQFLPDTSFTSPLTRSGPTSGDSSFSEDSARPEAPVTASLHAQHPPVTFTASGQAGVSAKLGSSFLPPTSTLDSALSHDSNIRASPPSPSPVETFVKSSSTRGPSGRSFSSLSLRDKIRPSPTPESFETSLGTPVKYGFATVPAPGRKSHMNASSEGMSIAPVQPGKKVHLFANEIHAPHPPSSPKSRVLQHPRPLEPCPESSLLRPFWLMRCIYQTIAHPRGGYITTKLFIPRDVWIVKNVKLKGVDEKVVACDLLTAALIKLSAVDPLDADALEKEMTLLEATMDQAQSMLSKKLGNDVGVQTISSLFKDAPPQSGTGISFDKSDGTADGSVNATTTGSFGNNSAKSGPKSSYLSSWRKLRSKSSSNSLGTSFSSIRDGPKESLTMSTLPMISSNPDDPPQRVTRKDVNRPVSARSELWADGPNGHYMGALAKLCEAAQVLDQIARQVEDPGLKKTSSTHVGLELSARHAAEFFGFYVCRFVLQDITMLADKFVKRATEWVLL